MALLIYHSSIISMTSALNETYCCVEIGKANFRPLKLWKCNSPNREIDQIIKHETQTKAEPPCETHFQLLLQRGNKFDYGRH